MIVKTLAPSPHKYKSKSDESLFSIYPHELTISSTNLISRQYPVYLDISSANYIPGRDSQQWTPEYIIDHQKWINCKYLPNKPSYCVNLNDPDSTITIPENIPIGYYNGADNTNPICPSGFLQNK